jgi:uncharacterized protein (DUF1330 family)
MAACVIVDSQMTEPTSYAEYKRLAESTVTLRGRRAEILEGDWSPSRLVIRQFESINQPKTWHNSLECF